MPTFSVTIAAYQAADVIGAAIESALGQTAPPHEVIVCDDGSTDHLGEVLAAFGDRIVVLRKENGGAASATNAAARAASGEFVAILDSDDLFEPEKLAALGELAKVRPDLDLLMTDAYLDLDGRAVGRFSSATPFATTDQRAAILERCFVAWPATRRSTLLAAGGMDESLRVGHDWDCWIRLLAGGSRAGLVDEPLHRYRLSEGSLSGPRPEAIRDRVSVLEKAVRNPDLTEAEREIAKGSAQANRRRAVLTEAEWALRSGSRHRRRRSLEVAFAPRVGLRARVKAVGAAVAPGAAARSLERREARGGGSRLSRSAPGK